MTMMLRIFVATVVSLSVIPTLLAAPRNVSVKVLSTEGEAIAGIGIEFIPMPPDEPLGDATTVKVATNELGIAATVVDVPAGQQLVWARIVPAPSEGTPVQRLANQEWKLFIAVRDKFFLPHVFEVPMDDTNPVLIELQGSVTVTGRIVDETGEPWRQGMVGGFDISALAARLQEQRLDTEGRFTVSGLPKLRESDIYVAVGRSYRRLHLSAQQTRDDIDLGDIVVPRLRSPIPVEVTCVGLEQFRPGYIYDVTCGATLISADGNTLMNFVAAPMNGVVQLVNDRREGVIRVPEGTYYIVPGLNIQGAHVRLVLGAIEEGNRDALAGVPTVVAAEGVTARASVEINMANTYNVLRERATENR